MNGISIVIPAFNAERTLRECLEAIATLEWSGEVEVIVINDNNSDRTSEIASSFPRVRVIDIPHWGQCRATNIGIEAAHYDIIIVVGADAVFGRHQS